MTKRPTLAQLKRDRPEMFSGHYFSEPATRGCGFPPMFRPSDWCSKAYVTSKAVTEARDYAVKFGDAQQRWAALGNLGELRKVRK